MALVYRAELSPTKEELLRDWIPKQPWAGAVDTSTLEPIDAYRFDDPDGEVGIESHLVRTASGHVVHVPLTYRGRPRPGTDDGFITTMEHSVLGERWVYDACSDPVYVRTLAATILGGGTQAELVFEPPFEDGPPPVRTEVRGSGARGSGAQDDTASIVVPAIGSTDATGPVDAGDADHPVTTIRAGGLQIDVLHTVGGDTSATGETPVLTGVWPGREEPAVLAVLRAR